MTAVAGAYRENSIVIVNAACPATLTVNSACRETLTVTGVYLCNRGPP